MHAHMLKEKKIIALLCMSLQKFYPSLIKEQLIINCSGFSICINAITTAILCYIKLNTTIVNIYLFLRIINNYDFSN